MSWQVGLLVPTSASLLYQLQSGALHVPYPTIYMHVYINTLTLTLSHLHSHTLTLTLTYTLTHTHTHTHTHTLFSLQPQRSSESGVVGYILNVMSSNAPSTVNIHGQDNTSYTLVPSLCDSISFSIFVQTMNSCGRSGPQSATVQVRCCKWTQEGRLE